MILLIDSQAGAWPIIYGSSHVAKFSEKLCICRCSTLIEAFNSNGRFVARHLRCT